MQSCGLQQQGEHAQPLGSDVVARLLQGLKGGTYMRHTMLCGFEWPWIVMLITI